MLQTNLLQQTQRFEHMAPGNSSQPGKREHHLSGRRRTFPCAAGPCPRDQWPNRHRDGAEVVGIVEWDAEPMLVWDPGHPLASEEGYVVRPVIDVAHQMAHLIAAQRSYQLNLQVIKTGEESYQAALQIGRA